MSEWIGWLLINWLCADLIVGFFHWWEDQYANERWPLIGKYVSKPNQLHHSRPTAFLAGSYVQRNWTSIVPAVIAAAVAWRYCPALALPCLIASQGNEVHGWSHQKCNGLIRVLQETELVASVKHHAKHHVDPFSKKYCVMSGWLNPVLDGLRFWTAIELVIAAVFRVKPRSWGAS